MKIVFIEIDLAMIKMGWRKDGKEIITSRKSRKKSENSKIK
jgi:hypothetical protein